MDRKQLIKKYIEFFKGKKHREIKNSSLIPENDPSTLFISAGMQPIVPFFPGDQKHPLGKRLTNVQKCIRTVDIEAVGDTCHHTFFEQLGNWSLGDYFKTEAIEYFFDFLTNELKIPLEKLAASTFKGDNDAPKDKESYDALISIGFPKQRIKFLPKSENWWGPAGQTGPCGADSEMFYWTSEKPTPVEFDPKNKNWVELGNNVFINYHKDKKGNYSSLKQNNVDFGGGSERILALLEGHNDNYLTSSFLSIIKEIEKISKKSYNGNEKVMRIISDHIKAAVFIIADGITPSNTDQGYVLRRLIRRAIRFAKKLGIKDFTNQVAEPIFDIYDDYKHLTKNKKHILAELKREEEKFDKTLEKGMILFEKVAKDKKKISGIDAFLLYQSYGFPIEMTTELAKEKKIEVDGSGFYTELDNHQKLSRTASAGKFKSGLADEGEETTKLHTATHLLNAALKVVLKNKDIQQKGSNITQERLRFDFNFNRKLHPEEIKEIEDLVNAQIQKECEITRIELTPEEAKKQGAVGVFEDKYGNKVSVYTIKGFSKEICTGPHVKNTCELGKFRIKKEESSSSGIRRIKAILE